MKGSLFVISTPRSGSIFFAEIMQKYYKTKHKKDVQMLGRIFEPYSRIINSNNLTKTVFNYNPGEFYSTIDIDDNNRIFRSQERFFHVNEIEIRENELKRRILLVEKSENSKNFNIYHTHYHLLNDDCEDYLLNKFNGHIVNIGRKHVWNQILSFGIGYYTKIWRIENEQSIGHLKPGSFVYDINKLKIHMKNLINLNTDRWNKFPRIYYEDFVDNPLDSVPELLPQFSDLKEYVTPEDLKGMSKKMDYPCPKEDLFINIDEMRDVICR